MTINYHAHHAAPGAYGTFTLGHFGSRGGFGVNDGRKPGNQQVFAGFTRDGAVLRCLPFFEPQHDDATAAFVGEHGENAAASRKLHVFGEDEIRRDFRWATDEWTVPGFSVRMDSPFGSIPDPEKGDVAGLRRALLPAVTAELVWDNTAGETEMTGFFAVQFDEAGANLLPSGEGMIGLEYAGRLAIAASVQIGTDVRVIAGPDLHAALSARVPHWLFNTVGIAVRVPPGERRTLPLVLSWYVPGLVTGRLEGSYYYARCFASLLEATRYALTHHADRARWAREIDSALDAASLNAPQRFLIAHATRSYYGSTQLLEVAGEPFWIVNEGEYCMMNTFDLAVDQVFFEMRTNPWVVRNLLILSGTTVTSTNCAGRGATAFRRRLVHARHGRAQSLLAARALVLRNPGQAGLLQLHDPGAALQLGPVRGDLRRARKRRRVAARKCAGRASLPGKYASARSSRSAAADGVMAFDSSRCASGQEITTYDSLDASLGQARGNLYVAVKCWASYIGLARLLQRLGDTDAADEAEASAALTAKSVCAKYDPALGYIPAVFEDGNASAIIPAIECLIFPMEWADADAVSRGGRFGALIQTLSDHLKAVLRPGLCLCADGGWKLSSTSNNTWMSKIVLCQHVARELFGVDQPDADAAHERWQKEGCGYWAFCDQISDGKPIGSKYYPRGVTSILWMQDWVSRPYSGFQNG